nr:hypothetical protein Iba_chr04aCG16050 [Ipomoea batatas]
MVRRRIPCLGYYVDAVILPELAKRFGSESGGFLGSDCKWISHHAILQSYSSRGWRPLSSEWATRSLKSQLPPPAMGVIDTTTIEFG